MQTTFSGEIQNVLEGRKYWIHSSTRGAFPSPKGRGRFKTHGLFLLDFELGTDGVTEPGIHLMKHYIDCISRQKYSPLNNEHPYFPRDDPTNVSIGFLFIKVLLK